jgi:hypothetical protein
MRNTKKTVVCVHCNMKFYWNDNHSSPSPYFCVNCGAYLSLTSLTALKAKIRNTENDLATFSTDADVSADYLRGLQVRLDRLKECKKNLMTGKKPTITLR